MKFISGIYQIRNLINGKVYIGQSKNLYYRKSTHFSKLRYNNGHNKHLQNAWNFYGEINFKYEVILICEETELTYYENVIININKNNCYNTREAADSNRGLKLSEEQKRNYKGNTSCAKFYNGFISPTGEIFRNIVNLSKFCREQGLNKTHMSRVSRGLEKQSKDWIRLDEIKENQYFFSKKIFGNLISPDGIIYRSIKNISSFSKEHKLNPSHIGNLFSGKRKQHKGWKLLQET